jgi:hypothetical protein
MISPPYSLSRPDRYCRLLPPFRHSGDPKKVTGRLKQLAESMYLTTPVPEALAALPAVPDSGGPIAPVAYTYFGQFIMHDLTYDDTPFRSAGHREPEKTVNHRTPRLDLDSVYGDGPFSSKHHHLYNGVYFRLGEIKNRNEAEFDVPLDNNDLPMIADERNCENAIMRQVHVMFMRLHNLMVKKLDNGRISDKTLFEAARTRVRWQFQWLVRENFLPLVCEAAVCEAVTKKNQRLVHWPAGRFSIPVEFSQAAARFGHSMVKATYTLTKPPGNVHPVDVPLTSLFIKPGRKGPIDPDHAVEWYHFTSSRRTAQEIDTLLVDPLSRVPDESIDPFVTSPMPHEPHMLALRTLCRGAATKLPTGQQVRVALEPGAVLRVPDTNLAWPRLHKLGFANETPLWYYILLEAETNGKRVRLGTVGSRLVVEVIEAALLHDPGSILSQGSGAWEPPDWTIDGKQQRILNLYRLAIVVGLEPEHPEP